MITHPQPLSCSLARTRRSRAILERQRHSYAPHLRLATGAQRFNWRRTQHLVIGEEPVDGFIAGEASIFQHQEGAMQDGKRLITLHKDGGHLEDSVDTNGRQFPLLNQTANSARSNLKKLYEIGDGEIVNLVCRFCHTHQTATVGALHQGEDEYFPLIAPAHRPRGDVCTANLHRLSG